MNCQYCNKEINNKGGLKKHENGCSSNPNKIIYKSNFINYNMKIKNGELDKEFSNQYDKAKFNNKEIVISLETRKKMSEVRRGTKHSIKTKELLSEIRSKQIEDSDKGGFEHIKWFRLKNINNEEFCLRGTWELLVGNKLNESNILWVRKKYLKYKDESEVSRTYTPDFYIPEFDRYIEVKGYFSEKDKKKLFLVIQQNNIDLLLIKQDDIKNEYELINKIKQK